MSFGDFKMILYLGWIVPLLFLFCVWAEVRRRNAMLRFAQKDLLSKITRFFSFRVNILKMLLVITAVTMVVLALLRPQWGFFWRENTFKGLDIIIAIDTSKSMLARDVPPDRLEFTKERVKDFVRRLRKDRIGLIAFAGKAFLQCPLTVDYSGFMLVLKGINVNTIPRGGTSIAEAITEAARSYEGSATDDRILILITDGENTEGDVEKAVEKAKDEKIVISCIGIGSGKGEPIPFLDEDGKTAYVKDNKGEVVRSSLDEDTLKMIARQTGGMYVRADRDSFGLQQIYDERLSDMEEYELKEEMVKVKKERFQVFLGIGVFAMILAMVIGKKE